MWPQYLLYFAAKNGNTEVVRQLLKTSFIAEEQVNSKDEFEKTPLWIAAYNGHKEVVELLLSHKADVNAANSDGSHKKKYDAEEEI